MEKYIPDIYQKSIYDINYKKLHQCGIKCILFDLDNTLVPLNVKEPTDKLKEFISNLKKQGFKIILYSNCMKNRLKPFKEQLNVDCAPVKGKSFEKKINEILKMYNYKQAEVVIVGDKMNFDIVNGNKAGITTILINPISKKDHICEKAKRIKEVIIMKRLRNNNLFVKGRYYE